MGDVRNRNLQLGYTGEHSIYRADCQELQGNAWWIELAGHPELIRSIVDRDGIELQAVSITPAEFDAAKAAARLCSTSKPL